MTFIGQYEIFEPVGEGKARVVVIGYNTSQDLESGDDIFVKPLGAYMSLPKINFVDFSYLAAETHYGLASRVQEELGRAQPAQYFVGRGAGEIKKNPTLKNQVLSFLRMFCRER